MKKLIKLLIAAFALMGGTMGCSSAGLKRFSDGFNAAKPAPYVSPIKQEPIKSATTYNMVGNTMYGSDGSRCVKVGEQINCQ